MDEGLKINNNNEKSLNDVVKDLGRYFQVKTINKTEHKDFIVKVCEYALKTYKLEYLTLDFSDEIDFDMGYLCGADKITLSSKLLEIDNNVEFFFEAIEAIFHEVNHMFIRDIDSNIVKGLNGEVFKSKKGKKIYNASTGETYQLFNTINGIKMLEDNSLIFKKYNLSDKDIKNLFITLYYSSRLEISAYYSSYKLALKLLNEIKDELKNVGIQKFNFIEVIKEKFLQEYKMVGAHIESAKKLSNNEKSKLIINEIVANFQNDIMNKVASNVPFSSIITSEFQIFLSTINDSWWDEKRMDTFRNIVLASGYEDHYKIILYGTVLNTPNYKIRSIDMETLMNLVVESELGIEPVKNILFNIDEKLINKFYYNQLKVKFERDCSAPKKAENDKTI